MRKSIGGSRTAKRKRSAKVERDMPARVASSGSVQRCAEPAWRAANAARTLIRQGEEPAHADRRPGFQAPPQRLDKVREVLGHDPF